MRNPFTILILAASLQGGEPGTPSHAAIADAPVKTTVEALLMAYEDERKAEAFYAAVMVRYGEVKPFSNIIKAERRHQEMLIPLLKRFGITIPDGPVPIPDVPETLKACFEASVTAEVENIELYDRLMPSIEDEAVRSAFERLQWASRERHLVAFKRWAEGAEGAEGGKGRGRGRGRGRP